MGVQKQESRAEVDPGHKLSPENASALCIRGWDAGSIHITAHFKQRALERSFTTIDTENVIRYGKMRGDGEYCPEFTNWKYRFYRKVEDKELEVVVSLDPTKDYARPLVILLTGYWR